MARELRALGIPASDVAIIVQPAGGKRPTLAVNAGRAMNPASVMKLVTTYAALELLGPAHRWRTELWLDGGDLILRGTGDPKLNYESFWMMLRGLRARGVREIRGDVLLDRSYFAPTAGEPIDDEQYRPYNVAPDALLVNFKSLRFVFAPDGERVRIFVEPDLPGLELINGLRLGSGPCPEGRAFRHLIEAAFVSSPAPRAAFSGTYPLECGERDLNVALYSPEDYVAGMIRHLWSEMGGTWNGRVRDGTVPATAQLVHVHESPPLAEIVRDTNKFSNNVMARQLYLTLGAALSGPPGTPEGAQRAVRQWLVLKNILAPELVIENGSGLSRVERASAATIAALLQEAWHSPVMPEFIASLPVVAVDGTMRKRLHYERIAGSAHLKTGLLSDVRSMAGYVLDRSGRRHAVVMVVNHARAPQADAAFDALLKLVYEDATARGPSR
ncbi:MAG TPA: D-alanyl-D-alanine carboxypeptidase/D-alanyl-D-alanine-endopeptidase [Burkholderiales bacterium]|nr:D-alanyl-D-alanine carboxypeptidase/D-alanyl-D-alanine-endopeptidase [Burkholderiales bacterium]